MVVQLRFNLLLIHTVLHTSLVQASTPISIYAQLSHGSFAGLHRIQKTLVCNQSAITQIISEDAKNKSIRRWHTPGPNCSLQVAGVADW